MGGFTYIAYELEAHNYDLYSFSAIYSPNILQFIHNGASCNIPLRWDGTRDITSVSIIYHGTLHTNQLILIVHSYCRGMCLRKNNYSLSFSRTMECYYPFFFSRDPVFKAADKCTFENCGDRDGLVFRRRNAPTKVKFFKPLVRTRFASLSAQFLQYTSEYSPSLTPELAELFIETE